MLTNGLGLILFQTHVLDSWRLADQPRSVAVTISTFLAAHLFLVQLHFEFKLGAHLAFKLDTHGQRSANHRSCTHMVVGPKPTFTNAVHQPYSLRLLRRPKARSPPT
ncbi:hypothetical protein AMTRI_Chr07g76260 [Amborella trichopoda]